MKKNTPASAAPQPPPPHPYSVIGDAFGVALAPVMVCAGTSRQNCLDEADNLLESALQITDLLAEQLQDNGSQLSANTRQAAQCLHGVLALITYARGIARASSDAEGSRHA